MGAWTFIRSRLARVIDGRWPLFYLGRPQSSSPAEGSSAVHAANQQKLVEQAFNRDGQSTEQNGIIWEKA
jgi:2-oxoglutarate dehydrogenase E1 component